MGGEGSRGSVRYPIEKVGKVGGEGARRKWEGRGRGMVRGRAGER